MRSLGRQVNRVLVQGLSLSYAVLPGVNGGDNQELGRKDQHLLTGFLVSIFAECLGLTGPWGELPGRELRPGIIILNAQEKLRYN